jgi:hypothetical protein
MTNTRGDRSPVRRGSVLRDASGASCWRSLLACVSASPAVSESESFFLMALEDLERRLLVLVAHADGDG